MITRKSFLAKLLGFAVAPAVVKRIVERPVTWRDTWEKDSLGTITGATASTVWVDGPGFTVDPDVTLTTSGFSDVGEQPIGWYIHNDGKVQYVYESDVDRSVTIGGQSVTIGDL